MRGKHIDGKNEVILSRITPADAGKTHHEVVSMYVAEDHPRGCGENGGGRKTYER